MVTAAVIDVSSKQATARGSGRAGHSVQPAEPAHNLHVARTEHIRRLRPAGSAQRDDLPRRGERKRAVIGHGGRFGQAHLLVVSRHQVRENEPPGPGPGGVLGGLPGGQVHIRSRIRPGQVRRLTQQHIGLAGQFDKRRGGPGVSGVGQRPAGLLDPEAERLDRVVLNRAGVSGDDVPYVSRSRVAG